MAANVRWLTHKRLPPEQIRAARRISVETKKLVWSRDAERCRYCGRGAPRCGICRRTYCRDTFHGFGRTPWALDHVIPVQQGGMGTIDNIVLACTRCNELKGPRTPEQAGMRLLPVGEAA